MRTEREALIVNEKLDNFFCNIIKIEREILSHEVDYNDEMFLSHRRAAVFPEEFNVRSLLNSLTTH